MPDKLAAAAAALAEKAWITRRSDPISRLAGDRASRSSSPGRRRASTRRGLGRWAHRLAAAGVRTSGPAPAQPTPPDGEPYEHALALMDAGTTDGLLAAVAVLDELGARAVAALVRARLRERGVAAVPRGPSEVTRANRRG